ncbi:MAG: cell division protein ZapA [Nitrospinota bacterium]|nr:MAG: cell division protein ZapA [Nitrospinota bacterium]
MTQGKEGSTKQPTHVTILRNEITLMTDADPEYTQRLAAYVERKMQEVYEKSKPLSMTKVAIVAALNIADELFRLQQEKGVSPSVVEERIDDLLRMLDGLRL